MHTNRGFSLLELLIVLAIVGLLSIGLIPSFTQPLMRIERLIILSRLRLAIALAKQMAWTHGCTMHLCPSLDGRSCKKPEQMPLDWSQGFILMQQPTAIGKPHTMQKPILIYRFGGTRFGRLVFDQFGTFLHFQPNGYTDNSGTFTYCPFNQDRLEARGLVINKGGRVYELEERNPEGILLKAVGTPQERPVTCR